MNNVIVRGYKYRIYPSKDQESIFWHTFGCCRLIWNLMLSDRIETYKSTGKMQKLTPAAFKTDDRMFLLDVDSSALANEQMFLDAAYSAFFKGDSKFPKFKKKHNTNNWSYTTSVINNNIRLSDDFRHIKLPKVGWVRIKMHRNLPNGAVIKHVTVSKSPAGRWHCSICFECDESALKTKKHRKSKSSKTQMKKTVGLDYKSNGLFVSSNGTDANMPHFFRKMEKKLAREQRKLSRKKLYSNNWYHQKEIVAKLHEKVANQRADFLHKQSKALADAYSLICVEDLNMQAIARSLKLAKATYDNAFGMFRDLLAYKLEDRHGELIKAEKSFPSSQRCSCCGEKNPEVKNLKVREWTCPHCGTHHNRDVNAAENLKQYALGLI